MSVGYPDRIVASGINLEIEHGTRTAIVGDNGQGKTTFLRTLVTSLAPLSGEPRWGYGCRTGVYAQHVYNSLPEENTVLDYLEDCKSPEVRAKTVLDTAGSFLFQGEMVQKRIAVLSGGERARLCLAGSLLALATCWCSTSRATTWTSTRSRPWPSADRIPRHRALHQPRSAFHAPRGDGRDRGPRRRHRHLSGQLRHLSLPRRERSRRGSSRDRFEPCGSPAARFSAAVVAVGRQAAGRRRQGTGRRERGQQRNRQREAIGLERKIARLEERKQELNRQLMASTDPAEAQRFHEQIVAISAELEPAEAKWLELNADTL